MFRLLGFFVVLYMLNILPDDILDVIYKKKHELELKDVHSQLLSNYNSKINNVYTCINFFKKFVNHCLFILTNFNASDIFPLNNIFALYASLLHDGIIDKFELLELLIDFRKYVGLDEQHESRFVNDAKTILNDDTLCINIVLHRYQFILKKD